LAHSSTAGVEGIVVEVLPNALFRVELVDGGKPQVTAHVSTTMRLNLVKILPGARVRVELSAFDRSRGRIVSRQSR